MDVELCVQELINQEDCSSPMVKRRQEAVRQALLRHKNGTSPPEERDMLIQAMKQYRGLAERENRARIYNILLHFYFADNPLLTSQMPALFHINKRTVFKDISKGIEDLTVILYGIGGIDLLPDTKSDEFAKVTIQESIRAQLIKDLYQDMIGELRSFYKNYPSMNITDDKSGLSLGIKAKRLKVREALKRYKKGNSAPGERKELVQAMEKYRAATANEKHGRAYNILFLFYFAVRPLKAIQISDKYGINERTVFKYITKGVEDLTNIMYGSLV